MTNTNKSFYQAHINQLEPNRKMGIGYEQTIHKRKYNSKARNVLKGLPHA